MCQPLRRKNWVRKSRWAKLLLGRVVCRRTLEKRKKGLGGSEREGKLASPSRPHSCPGTTKPFLRCLPSDRAPSYALLPEGETLCGDERESEHLLHGPKIATHPRLFAARRLPLPTLRTSSQGN